MSATLTGVADDATTAEAPAGPEAEGAALAPFGEPVEIWKPSSDQLRGYFYARVLDRNGVRPSDIINVDTGFEIHLWASFRGALWRCICGSLCWDVDFESIGRGPEFSISERVQVEETVFRGCDRLDYRKRVVVPPNTIPADYCGGIVYNAVATLQMKDDCGAPAPVAGHRDLGKVQFYHPDAD